MLPWKRDVQADKGDEGEGGLGSGWAVGGWVGSTKKKQHNKPNKPGRDGKAPLPTQVPLLRVLCRIGLT
jgi:hypothetical protein